MNLLKHAVPSMENTYEQIAGTGSVVLFANAEGAILCSRGDPDFMSGTFGHLFVPGVSWAEGTAGTNAIGSCIAGCAPITVDAGGHDLKRFRSLCGSAAPIFDSSGALAGVLAVYGTTTAPHSHTLGFIRTVAVMIENRALAREMSSEIVIHFHPVAEYIGTIKQGIVVFGNDGKLLGSNGAARDFFRISNDKIAGTHFNDVFCLPFSLPGILENAQAGSGQFTASTADGREITLSVTVGARGRPRAIVPLTTEKTGQDRPGPSCTSVLLSNLDLGDPLMHRAIVKASMILGSDIPLLIEGESGVGKEVFTAAFHNSGPRQNGPFVAVNCAAIPEGLIESELFGYAEGAYTGANKRGYQGRLLQANGGTLFLDEIGDMPLSLQGRLLRVLQERLVNPLGSTKSVPVDVSIVCATHRTMQTEVAAGRFREDLYYRLNGLRIQLPSLRQRQDLDQLIDLVVSTESGGRSIELGPDVRRALLAYPWPGNIRQLQMVVRTALAIMGRETRLTLEHLPDELIQLRERDSQPFSPLHDPGAGDLASIELDAIRKAVVAADGNMSKASRALGISRKTLYRKLSALPAHPAARHTEPTDVQI